MQETQIKSKEEISKDTIVSGIYKIINKFNGKYYIGSSANIQERWRCHLKELKGKYHHNDHLQRAWVKYGSENFEFVIVKSDVSPTELLKEEQFLLDLVKEDRSLVYNVSFLAGKVEMTDETKRKIGFRAIGHKRNVGRKYSAETVEKRKKSRSWYRHSQLTKEKIGNALRGRSVSDETKHKISKSLQGNIPHNVDYTIFEFHNVKSGEKFIGTKNDFIKRFNLFKQPVYAIINKSTRLRTYKGWTVSKS